MQIGGVVVIYLGVKDFLKSIRRIAYAAEVQAGIAKKEAEKPPLMNTRSSGAGIGPDFGHR